MFALLALSGFAGVVHGGATRVAPMAWSIARDVDGAALVDRPDACGFASRVAPDGLIRFVYGEGSRLYFGKEGGAPGVPITGPTVPCQDPDLAFKPDGTAVVGWIDSRNRGIDLWNTDAFVATEDSGWQESLVTGSTDGRVEALRIDVDAAGIVHAVYRRFTLQIWPYDDFLFAASSPSWQEAQVSDGHAINTFDLGFDSRGNTHVTWFSTDGYYAVWYANESAGWADVRVDKDQDLTRYDARFDASIAVDASDVPHVVWADSRNAPQYGSWRSEIWHASSVDGFTNRELVQPDDASLIVRKRGPHLLIDGAGVFHVAFTGDVEDASYQTSTNLYYGSSTDWDRAVQITNATQADPGWRVFLAHPVDVRGGTPVLTYVDSRKGYATLWRTEPWDFGPDVTLPGVAPIEDRVVDLPAGFLIEAVGAWDNDRIVSYDWDFAGPSTVRRSGYRVSLSFPAVGTYLGRLTVRDPVGNSVSVDFNVTVRNLSTRSWETGKRLMTLYNSYGPLHFQPLPDGSLALVFQYQYAIVDPSGRIRTGPVRLSYDVARETYVVDPVGNLHAVGFRNPELEYSKMRGDGSELVHSKVLSTGGLLPQLPSLAYSSGRLWLSWMDQRDGNMEIYLAALDLNGDMTWGPTRISNDSAGSAHPRLLPQANRLWIVWQDDRAFATSAYASVLNTSTMTFEFEEVRLADGYSGGIAALPDGGIAFTTSRLARDSWDLYSNRANRTGAPTATPVRLSLVDGWSSSGGSIAADARGILHLAWQDMNNGSWTRTARVSETGTVDPVGGLLLRFAGGYTPSSIAVALGPDGEPRIAYTQGPDMGAELLFAYHDPIPPRAVIDAPATAKVGAIVTFDATASTDNDEIVGYRWSFSDGTTLNGSVVSRGFIRGGTVAVRLDVTDGADNVGTAQGSIAVADEFPFAMLAGPRVVDEDATVNFSALGSTDDGGIVEYAWTISGPWSASGTGPLLEVVFPEPGEYTVRLIVTDTGGNTNETSLHVTVRDLLEPWVVPSIIWAAILAPEVVTAALLARHWKRRVKELWGEGEGSEAGAASRTKESSLAPEPDSRTR